MNDQATNGSFNDERVFRAAMEMAASKGWEKCSLSEIAAAADVDIAAVTRVHRNMTGILRALAARIDTETLAGMDPGDGPEIPIRERLLESLMLRFDMMEPYKPGIVSVARSALSTPGLALEGASALARSMSVTLSAAGIATRGPLGLIRIKAMSLIFLDAFRVWIDDAGPDHSATHRRLDERLNQAERLALTLGIARQVR